MARRGTSQGMRRPPQLNIVHTRAAGIAVGATFHVVAVPPDLSPDPVQTLQSFPGDLDRLADGLVEIGVTTVAMESTGIDWMPVFDILEAHGLEVLLVHARHVKNVPGRQTDVTEAQWMQPLHQYGLLRGSVHPAQAYAALRAYLRHRERLLAYAASHIQPMQKALMHMNVPLHHVFSDITGVTGRKIMRAIIAGQHDPAALATYRDAHGKASEETMREALTGHYRREHVLTLRHALARSDSDPERIAACDQEIEATLESLHDADISLETLPAARYKQTRQDNAPTCDVREMLFRV